MKSARRILVTLHPGTHTYYGAEIRDAYNAQLRQHRRQAALWWCCRWLAYSLACFVLGCALGDIVITHRLTLASSLSLGFGILGLFTLARRP